MWILVILSSSGDLFGQRYHPPLAEVAQTARRIVHFVMAVILKMAAMSNARPTYVRTLLFQNGCHVQYKTYVYVLWGGELFQNGCHVQYKTYVYVLWGGELFQNGCHVQCKTYVRTYILWGGELFQNGCHVQCKTYVRTYILWGGELFQNGCHVQCKTYVRTYFGEGSCFKMAVISDYRRNAPNPDSRKSCMKPCVIPMKVYMHTYTYVSVYDFMNSKFFLFVDRIAHACILRLSIGYMDTRRNTYNIPVILLSDKTSCEWNKS